MPALTRPCPYQNSYPAVGVVQAALRRISMVDPERTYELA